LEWYESGLWNDMKDGMIWKQGRKVEWYETQTQFLFYGFTDHAKFLKRSMRRLCEKLGEKQEKHSKLQDYYYKRAFIRQ